MIQHFNPVLSESVREFESVKTVNNQVCVKDSSTHTSSATEVSLCGNRIPAGPYMSSSHNFSVFLSCQETTSVKEIHLVCQVREQ